MKAVNILKKILTACAILIVFAGCSDFETDSPAAEAGLYVVKGSVSMEGSTAARTATSTSTKVFDSSLPWKFAAHKYSGGEVDRSVCYEPSGFYGGIFTFAFTEFGEYQIEAYLASEDGQHYAYGSTVITVSEDGQQLESIVIPVELLATTEPGSVNLDIYFDDSEETAEITEMQVEWIGLEDRAMAVREALGYDREAANAALMKGEEYTLSEEVQAKLAALDEWGSKCAEGQFNTIQPVTNGHTVISLSPEHNQGIFYGTHAVKIKFMSSSGKLVYSCKEMINVYSGMTTDTWYGTSPNIVSQGNFGGKFLITGERIKRYIKPESQEPEEPEEPEAKTIKICFRFQNGEGEYAAIEEIPDISMTFEEADEWSEKINGLIEENTVKAVVLGYKLNEEKTEKEPELDGDAYFVNVYFDKAEKEKANVGGVTVTLAEFDTTDLGANFTMSEEKGADGSITLTATQDPVESGYSYQWFIDGNLVAGEIAPAYTWTAEKLNLGTGVHDVTLMITFTSGEKTESYSAKTTFTVKAE